MPINKIIFGNKTLIDLTSDTAKEANVFKGQTFHTADGSKKTGTFSIDEELEEQENLILQIKQALEGKVGGGDTPGYQIYNNNNFGTIELNSSGLAYYSLDDGQTWIDFYDYHNGHRVWLFNVKKIRFKVSKGSFFWGVISSETLNLNISGENGTKEEAFEINKNIEDLSVKNSYPSGGGGSS